MALGFTFGLAIAQFATSADVGAAVAATPLPTGDLTQNGSFETGLSPWQEMPDTNLAAYTNGQSSPDATAFEGTHYAATNTSSSGGAIYENLTGLTINAGDALCGTAEVRNDLSTNGASGSFVIWLLGGTHSENGGTTFSGLGNGTNWEQVTTCATATTAHSRMRIEFYPTPGAPTLDIDAVHLHAAVNVQQPVSQNGGFESGVPPWQVAPSTNFATYANGQLAPGDTAFSGTHYAAVNTSVLQGGIYEKSDLTINPGDTLCGTTEVRNQVNSTGAGGSFVIWLQGGSHSENGVASFSGLGNGSAWTQVSECVTATIAHSGVQIQFYPTPGAPTLDVDGLSVHDELAVANAANAPDSATPANGSGPTPTSVCTPANSCTPQSVPVKLSTPTADCTPTNSCTPQSFADLVLSQPGIDAPITTANEYAIETWELAEGGGAGCPGQAAQASPWQNSIGPAGNPLNTTQPEPGDDIWNGVGVRIYSDGSGHTCWYWGILATVQTLTGSIGNYGPIVAALQNPVADNRVQCDRVATAVGNSKWGTGDFSQDC